MTGFAAIACGSPMLREVHLDFEDLRFEECRQEARLEGAASAFLDCRQIRQLQHNYHSPLKKPCETIADKCRRLQLVKTHDLDVQLLGVDYGTHPSSEKI